MPDRRLKVLFFCDNTNLTNTCVDHVDAFFRHSQHEFILVNPIRKFDILDINFNAFDAILIDYTVCIMHDYFLSPHLRKRIAAFKGPKLQLIQDEYRWVNVMSEKMAALGITTLFTILKPEDFNKGYSHPKQKNIRKVNIEVTGWVPDSLLDLKVPSIAERTLDIVYRGRILPFSLGKLAYEKFIIGEAVRERAKAYQLRTDISSEESARIYGSGWTKFLSSGRTTLGTESGASIWDHDDTVWKMVRDYQKKHPNATFDEVSNNILAPFENNVNYRCASPKIFEAIALKTPLILFPGQYSNIIEPGKHYITLEKDFSNFDDVVRTIKNSEKLQEIADTAYRDVIASKKYAYLKFITFMDQEISNAVELIPEYKASTQDHLLNLSSSQKSMARFFESIWFPIYVMRQIKTRLDREGYTFDQLFSIIKIIFLRIKCIIIKKLKTT